MTKAMEIAREAKRKIAFTLSDIACINPHRSEMLAMLDSGSIDLLFGNEAEIVALAGTGDLDSALFELKDKVQLIVATCGERGAIALEGGREVRVPIARIGKTVIDTTGAGDLFAAGFLVGQAKGRSLERSLRMGAIAAAEVISHFGARPEADLRTLIESA